MELLDSRISSELKLLDPSLSDVAGYSIALLTSACEIALKSPLILIIEPLGGLVIDVSKNYMDYVNFVSLGSNRSARRSNRTMYYLGFTTG